MGAKSLCPESRGSVRHRTWTRSQSTRSNTDPRMTTKPNILLVMTDQQRADTIGALGAPWMHTPNLDRMVREGAAFTNCFVTSPVCVGSRASLFTGLYPHGAGVFSNFQPWEPNWVRWLAEAG